MQPDILRLVRTLVRPLCVEDDIALGVALRTDREVVGAVIVGVGAGTFRLRAHLEACPESRCVLTLMVGAVARIDFPVQITGEGGPSIRARIDGTPLVIRRRIVRNAQLEQALGAAA